MFILYIFVYSSVSGYEMEGYFAMQFIFCVDIDVANRAAGFFVAI